MTQEAPICRFCLDSKNQKSNPLIEPCNCRGSLQFVHAKCLSRWRRMNPERNADTCLLCFSPYTLALEDGLEHIPDFQSLPILFLRFPFILCISANYIAILHHQLARPRIQFHDTFKMYQYVYQLLYIILFHWHWNVKNKGLYTKYWANSITAFFMFILILSNVYVDSLGLFSTLPINVSFALLYKVHIDTLVRMNQR